MKLPFYVDMRPNHSGVTGSCFHMKAVFPNRNTYSCLVDCGLFQGKYETSLNDVPLFPFIKNANTLVLTHNHVDHVGRVLELVRNGFRGNIITSEQTFGLLDKAWRDCVKIEKLNATKANRLPRYTSPNVTEALRHVTPLEFGKKFQIHPNIRLTLFQNGHVFGSAMVLIEIKSGFEGYEPINLFFTGDYNNQNYFFSVPEIPDEVKKMPLNIICESTYGEDSRQDGRQAVFEKNIVEQINKGKEIFIPTFAFERAQIVLAILNKLQKEGRLGLNIPIYVEGKLLKEYTSHYIKNASMYFDKIHRDEILPQNLHWIIKPNQKKDMLGDSVTKIIIASGGMLSFGPSQSYISYLVSNHNAVIHFTGYQCEGTIGHSLNVASKTGELLELMGKLVKVECSVFYTSEFSSHALQSGLLQLISQFQNRRSINLNHGSQAAKLNFAKKIILAKLAKEVGILSRENIYRFSPYGLEKVVSTSTI